MIQASNGRSTLLVAEIWPAMIRPIGVSLRCGRRDGCSSEARQRESDGVRRGYVVACSRLRKRKSRAPGYL